MSDVEYFSKYIDKKQFLNLRKSFHLNCAYISKFSLVIL